MWAIYVGHLWLRGQDPLTMQAKHVRRWCSLSCCLSFSVVSFVKLPHRIVHFHLSEELRIFEIRPIFALRVCLGEAPACICLRPGEISILPQH